MFNILMYFHTPVPIMFDLELSNKTFTLGFMLNLNIISEFLLVDIKKFICKLIALN